MWVPLRRMEALASCACASRLGSFFAWPYSSSNLWSKNKAPYEARQIYARCAWKSNPHTNFGIMFLLSGERQAANEKVSHRECTYDERLGKHACNYAKVSVRVKLEAYASRSGTPRWRRNFSASAFVFADVTIVTARPKMSFESSSAVSGNTVCSLMPMVMFPISSMADDLMPRKSFVRGRTMWMSLSTNARQCAPRSVAWYPTMSPWRILKVAIDFLACRGLGAWPVMRASRS